MDESTKVYVVRVGKRSKYYLEWKDLITQRCHRRVTNVAATGFKKDLKNVQRLATELEIKLRNGAGRYPQSIYGQISVEDMKRR